MISILIPTFNDICLPLVRTVRAQAENVIPGSYEIIVADDGSSDPHVKETNRQILGLSHCKYIERKENTGRSAIRNFLAQEAQGDRLLYIDADRDVDDPDFLRKYAAASESFSGLVYGGYRVGRGPSGNLRYRYERAAEHLHTAEQRSSHPYLDFNTSNFLVPRTIMLAHPFDTRIRRYGYEDVLFGKVMRQLGVEIRHRDIPVVFSKFETNESFLVKTEEGLRTLHEFQGDLQGYSRLLEKVQALSRLHMTGVVCSVFRLFSSYLRKNIMGKSPSLFLFKAYKLGYFLTLCKK